MDSEKSILAEIETVRARERSLLSKLDAMRAQVAGREKPPVEQGESFAPLIFSDEVQAVGALRQANGDALVGRSVARFAAEKMGAGPLSGQMPMEPLAHWLSLAAEGAVAPVFWQELREVSGPAIGKMDAGILASSFGGYGLRAVRAELGEEGLAKLAWLAKAYGHDETHAKLVWTHEISHREEPMAKAAALIVKGATVEDVLGGVFEGNRLGMETSTKTWICRRAVALSHERLGETINQDDLLGGLAIALSGSYEFEGKKRFGPQR